MEAVSGRTWSGGCREEDAVRPKFAWLALDGWAPAVLKLLDRRLAADRLMWMVPTFAGRSNDAGWTELGKTTIPGVDVVGR